jgi:hypothetical protein
VSPDHTNEIERRSSEAVRKRPDDRLADSLRRPQILEPQPVENVLPGWQILNQYFGGKIRFRQGICE